MKVLFFLSFIRSGIEYLIHCLAISVFVLAGGFRKYEVWQARNSECWMVKMSLIGCGSLFVMKFL